MITLPFENFVELVTRKLDLEAGFPIVWWFWIKKTLSWYNLPDWSVRSFEGNNLNIVWYSWGTPVTSSLLPQESSLKEEDTFVKTRRSPTDLFVSQERWSSVLFLLARRHGKEGGSGKNKKRKKTGSHWAARWELSWQSGQNTGLKYEFLGSNPLFRTVVPLGRLVTRSFLSRFSYG